MDNKLNISAKAPRNNGSIWAKPTRDSVEFNLYKNGKWINMSNNKDEYVVTIDTKIKDLKNIIDDTPVGKKAQFMTENHGLATVIDTKYDDEFPVFEITVECEDGYGVKYRGALSESDESYFKMESSELSPIARYQVVEVGSKPHIDEDGNISYEDVESFESDKIDTHDNFYLVIIDAFTGKIVNPLKLQELTNTVYVYDSRDNIYTAFKLEYVNGDIFKGDINLVDDAVISKWSCIVGNYDDNIIMYRYLYVYYDSVVEEGYTEVLRFAE